MREETFWCKKPRYSEVRVIARRVIARYDCTSFGFTAGNLKIFLSVSVINSFNIKEYCSGSMSHFST